MSKRDKYYNELQNLRKGIVADISELLHKERAIDVQLHNPIIYNYIDEQFNEVISRVNPETDSVQIDTGSDDYWVEMSELSTDQLLGILGAVEGGDYEIWEEFEEEK
jgi:hypothetical protein